MRLANLPIRTKILGEFFLVVAVFSVMIFLWILPTMRSAVYQEKQTMLQNLGRATVALMADFDSRSKKGEFSQSEAKKQALACIRSMRYGAEMKDYFWVNDFNHIMVMHPYSPQMEGKDQSEYKDKQGKFLFREVVRVGRQGEGFVDYMWQWKDDKDRIVPKLSFVKAYEPWGYIVGTGVYVNDVEEQIGALRNLLLLVVVPILVVIMALMYFPIRDLRRLLRVAEGVNQASDEVKSASGQVSSVSQHLAEGSSEQAASLEETSSSLEEMSSMTKRNAESARTANTMMVETAKAVKDADQAMSRLTASMVEISTASRDTARIIKTIDEIAFQTNLLALNAAVEAARAGEAGAGFAVVADEVRSLASRAAEAARTTAGLIETTVLKVKGGSELVSQTAGVFRQVSGSTEKTRELVAEIAVASDEQAKGIEQVNKAVSEMNRVVQASAASAEEAAAAAEELNAQSETMKALVDDLTRVVAGSRD